MKKLTLLFFTIMFCMFLVSAQPPFESSTTEDLQFSYPQYTSVKENTDFHLHIHVINKTEIQTNLTTSCLVHLYNEEGVHICEEYLGFDSNYIEFDKTIDAGNFTEGHKAYILYCNNTNKEQHLVGGEFIVTANGYDRPTDNVIIFFCILFILISAGYLLSLLNIAYHSIALDLDAKDMSISVASYIGVFATYILAVEYLGNSFINSILELVIDVGAVTHVIIPIAMFIVFFIKSNMEKAKGDHN